MKMTRLILATSFALVASALAAEPYAGKFVHTFKDGSTYDVTVQEDGKLTWECTAGEAKGNKGEGAPDLFKVADDTYFITWVEKSGTVISDVINFKAMTIYSTIVIDGKRYVATGKIERKP
ncbi:MAG: hypothetical protein JWO82_2142 [Akkermansiaceae bacterium]|nr:hypothetical protein [Akkermansiaceae bacterium]